MRKVMVEVWVKGKRAKRYTEWFYAACTGRTHQDARNDAIAAALANVKLKFSRFYPENAEWKIVH
jgi:hypothetical protein